MSIPGLLIALVLSLIALAIVLHPLLRPARREPTVESGRRQQLDRLEIYYERVLTNIRDLDEDNSTGKINEDDYRTEREVWVQRGIRLLRALDQLEGEDAEGIERAIKEAVAAYREGVLQSRREPAEGEAT
jgi:cytochrome c-type biogenesis protein CcmI